MNTQIQGMFLGSNNYENPAWQGVREKWCKSEQGRLRGEGGIGAEIGI